MNQICVVMEFSNMSETEVQEFLSEKFADMEKGGCTISCLNEKGYEDVKKILNDLDRDNNN